MLSGVSARGEQGGVVTAEEAASVNFSSRLSLSSLSFVLPILWRAL